MKEGLISIITPTYNCGKFIKETIESVQNQTYENWEMIIVDDCSTDDTKAVVEEISKVDARIKYYCLEVNSGAAVARTKAMELAEGEYMAFLDSDDLWLNNKLELQLNFMVQNDYAFTCTAYEKISETGEKLKKKIVKAIPKTNYNRLLLDCPVGNSTVMYSVKKMGKFEVPNIRKRNDDALWLQMLKKEQYIYGLNQVLMQYRLRQSSLSHKKLDLIKHHWYLYRKIEKLNVFRSAFHVCVWCFIKVFRIK